MIRNTLLSLFFCLITTTCFCKELVVELPNYNVRFNMENDQLHGNYYSYYKDGNQAASGAFYHNQRFGKWVIYNEKGEPQLIRYYKDLFHYSTYPDSIAAVPEYTRNSNGYLSNHFMKEENTHIVHRYMRRIDPTGNPDLFGSTGLFAELYSFVQNFEVRIYHPDNYGFELEITIDSIDQVLKRTPFEPDHFEVIEDWFVDSERKLAEKRIIALAPVIKPKGEPEKRLCWFYFPELRPYFASLPVLISAYTNIKHIDDLFFFRYFSSEITHKIEHGSVLPLNGLIEEVKLIEMEHQELLSFSNP